MPHGRRFSWGRLAARRVSRGRRRTARPSPEGNAVLFCEGVFGTARGKTGHELVRRTRRYRVTAVIDSRAGGRDAGEVLDGRPCGLPVVSNLVQAVAQSSWAGAPATHFVLGMTNDGGRSAFLTDRVLRAAAAGLHVDSALPVFFSDDPKVVAAASLRGTRIRDVRKPPPRASLHLFSGKIEQVCSYRVAVLGTDAAVGKRTTAWELVDSFDAAGLSAVFAGTGPTAWLQGADYSIIQDSLPGDFVPGEIEHMIWSAWQERRPDVIVLEGRSGILHPVRPGGFELLAAGRPHAVVLQHAPARRVHAGFPARAISPLRDHIRAVELVSGRPVVAITVNPEGLDRAEAPAVCARIREETGLPVFDVLEEGVGPLVEALVPYVREAQDPDLRAAR